MEEIFRFQGDNDEYLILCVIDDEDYYVYQGGAYFPKKEAVKLADAIYQDLGKGWISVEDRLPEIGDEVIIYSPTNGFFISEYNLFPHFRDGDKPIFEYQNVNPTHWMPLPDPPEAE